MHPKRKKNRNDVREVLENLDEHTELLKKMLTEELFIPDYHKPSIINESSSKKTRRILKPHYKYEQVIHHCAIGQFKPIVMNGLYEFSCGSIPDRGVHYGKKYMRKWLDSYDGKKFFVLKTESRSQRVVCLILWDFNFTMTGQPSGNQTLRLRDVRQTISQSRIKSHGITHR